MSFVLLVICLSSWIVRTTFGLCLTLFDSMVSSHCGGCNGGHSGGCDGGHCCAHCNYYDRWGYVEEECHTKAC